MAYDLDQLYRNVGGTLSRAMQRGWFAQPQEQSSPQEGFYNQAGPFTRHMNQGAIYQNRAPGWQSPQQQPFSFGNALKTVTQPFTQAAPPQIGTRSPSIAGRNVVDAMRTAWGAQDERDPGLRAALAISHAESGWDPNAYVNNDVEESAGIFQTNIRAHGQDRAHWSNVDNSVNKWVPTLRQEARNLIDRGVDLSTPEGIWALYSNVINPGVKQMAHGGKGSAQWNNVMRSFNSLDANLEIARSQPPGVQSQDPHKAIAFAKSQKGKRYAGPIVGEEDSARWGDPGWDCSSFVSAAFRELGVKLTPYTDSAYRETRAVSGAPQAGDIVFFSGYEDGQDARYKHMGIYLGDGQMIDSSYGRGVSIRSVSSSPGRAEFRRAL